MHLLIVSIHTKSIVKYVLRLKKFTELFYGVITGNFIEINYCCLSVSEQIVGSLAITLFV